MNDRLSAAAGSVVNESGIPILPLVRELQKS